MKTITLLAMLGATTTSTHAYWNLRLYSSILFQNEIYGQTQSYPTACSALPAYIRDATSSLNFTSTDNTICRDNTSWTVRLYGRPECEENWILLSQKANGSADDLGFVAKRCESFMVQCLIDDD